MQNMKRVQNNNRIKDIKYRYAFICVCVCVYFFPPDRGNIIDETGAVSEETALETTVWSL